jgi:hypothetical protein
MSLEVRSLGPCQTCGREKLATAKMEPKAGGGFGVHMVWYVDCGKCPVLRVEQLPPSDEGADDEILPF